MSIEQSLLYKLHSALKITDFWPQFMQAISEEISLMSTETENTKLLNSVDNTLENELIELSRKFGYPPNLIIDNTRGYIQKEIESVPYRIRNKTTYNGYYINFKQIDVLGSIFNLYWNGVKLIDAVRWEDTLSYLNSGSFILTDPFLYLTPDKNFSIIQSSAPIHLDTGRFLDDDVPWFLDENLVILPTKHISTDFLLNKVYNVNGKDYLIYDTYFRYLSQGVEYNRRIPIVPHLGALLNIICSSDGVYNSFNPSLLYTTPDLKLKASTTFEYSKVLNPVPPIQLDTGKYLDDVPTWRLDNYTSDTISIENFKYLVIGNGSYGNCMISSSIKDIFSPSNLIVYYKFEDEDTSTTLVDQSYNNFNLTISGSSPVKVTGLIEKCVNYTGATRVISSSAIGYFDDSYSFGLWFRYTPPTGQTSLYTACILDTGFLRVDIQQDFSSSPSFTNARLHISFSSYGEAYVPNIIVNTKYNLQILIDYENLLGSIYLNNALATFSFTTPSIAGNNYLCIGSDYLESVNKFIGLIDEVFIARKVLNPTEVSFLYTNEFSIITNLKNRLYRVEIDNKEKYGEDTNWFGIQTYAKGNSKNDELAFTYSTGTNTYLGSTDIKNIIPMYFSVSYTRYSVGFEIPQTAVDNGNGVIEDDYISGTIDYTTGDFVLNTSRTLSNLQDVLATEPISSYHDFVETNIKPSTLKIIYSMSGSSIIAVDNGLGDVLGTGISSGTINYITGQLDITFSNPTEGDTVIAQYNYYIYPTITNGVKFILEYKTYNQLEITELGIENEDNKLLAYATFPAIQFENMYNHLSMSLIIRR